MVGKKIEFKTYFEGRSKKISPGTKRRVNDNNSILGLNNKFNNWMLLYYSTGSVYMCNHIIFLQQHYEKHSMLLTFLVVVWETEI